MDRRYVYGVSVLMAGLALWPAARDPSQDSFPLSTFPMFSDERPRTMRITHAVGMTAGGARVPLSPDITSTNPEVLQSMATVIDAVRAGPPRRFRYCVKVAERVARSDDDALRPVREVQLVTARFHAIDYFEQGPEPLERRVHERCEVLRR